MKNLMKRKFWIGTVVVLIAGTFLYGCEDFLNQPAQGSLDANTLANANGVEVDCSLQNTGRTERIWRTPGWSCQ